MTQGFCLFGDRCDDHLWIWRRYVICGLCQLLAHVITVNDVGGLRVQVSNIFLVKPLPEASHLRELATRLHHHQDADQAQQQID